VTFIADALNTLEREAVIPPVASTAIRLLFLTGCRKGEILSLRWDYVDFDRHCLRLPDSKTGAKIVPIAAAALAILSGLSRTTMWVLPATKGQGHYVGLQKHWAVVKLKARALALEASGRGDKSPADSPHFDNVRLHDLRHSFASFAVMDGAPLYLVNCLAISRRARPKSMRMSPTIRSEPRRRSPPDGSQGLWLQVPCQRWRKKASAVRHRGKRAPSEAGLFVRHPARAG
jgi:integrase